MHSWRIETSALLLHEAVDGSLNWGRRLESILASREGGSLGGTWLFASHESSLPPHQGYDDYLPNDTSGPQERWQQPEGVVATGTLYRPTWTAIGQPYRRHRPFAWPLNSSTGGDDLKHQRLPGRMDAELGRGSSAGCRTASIFDSTAGFDTKAALKST